MGLIFIQIGNAGMGCGPSQAVIVQQQSTNLRPTIFMVAEESVELLRDLGELKLYHLAQYGETEQVERRHGEFASRLANPVESVRKESTRHANEHARETARQSPAWDANILKARSVVSRVYKVKETTTMEVASCSNQMPSVAFSSTTKGPTSVTGKDLETSSMSQNECPGDVPANPGRSVQIIPAAANHSKDFAPAPSSSSPNLTSAPAETPCTVTLETRHKTKTFFGRNRVKPKAKAAFGGQQ